MKFSVSVLTFSVLAAIGADAFTPSAFSGAPMAKVASSSSLKMSLEKYSDELRATAAQMVRPGFGLLACDESTGTVGARLESIGLENIEKNRQEVSITHFFHFSVIITVCVMLYLK